MSATAQSPAGQLGLEEAEQFLYYEAELIDERDYERWLDLFLPDGLYWLPSSTTDLDPATQISIIYDDDRARRLRVERLLSGKRDGQIPPSLTCHAISNVRVRAVAESVLVR